MAFLVKFTSSTSRKVAGSTTACRSVTPLIHPRATNSASANLFLVDFKGVAVLHFQLEEGVGEMGC